MVTLNNTTMQSYLVKKKLIPVNLEQQFVLIFISSEKYSAGRRNSSTNKRVKCVQYGVFTRKIHVHVKYMRET